MKEIFTDRLTEAFMEFEDEHGRPPTKAEEDDMASTVMDGLCDLIWAQPI